jgi:hypothetical protein
MYAVSGRAQDDKLIEAPAIVQTVDGQFVQVPGATRLGYVNALQPAAAPLVVSQTPAPRQTVYRPAVTQPAAQRVVVQEAPRQSNRSWAKTAMIIGGSAGAGAGVGGLVGGKKGALVGAAIGGGAASIYEATRR